MGPQHTFNSPHLPTLTFPYISPYLPHTPSHFPTPPFIPLPTSLLPPPTPQHIFLLSPHISPHLLKVWRSYHATKFLWRSYCGEVTMWRSYWQPGLILYITRQILCDGFDLRLELIAFDIRYWYVTGDC